MEPGPLHRTKHPAAPGLKRILLLFALVLLGLPLPAAHAQKDAPLRTLQPLAPGVTLPVRLNRSLEAGKTTPGTTFLATTTQRTPVGNHCYLHHGATLHGQVVASNQGDGTASHPSTLSLRFTSLEYRRETVPIATRAIAIANFVQVDAAALPANGGSDRGNNSPASWTTYQVGGDVIDRSGWIGDLDNSAFQKVGSADYFGVYTLPQPPANGNGLSFPRALGVFSATAAGLYGLDEGTTLHSAGGTITLTRSARKLLLRVGDNLLLEVVSSTP